MAAYNTPTGAGVLLGGLAVSLLCYPSCCGSVPCRRTSGCCGDVPWPAAASSAACFSVRDSGSSLSRLPSMRSVSFTERIEPQLKEQNLESRLLRPDQGGLALRAAGADTAAGAQGRGVIASRFNPGPPAAHRLGPRRNQEISHGVQGGTGALGSHAGFILAPAGGRRTRHRDGSIRPRGPRILAAPLGGFLSRDYLLGPQIARREEKMMAEFPGLAELMALAVGAGESAMVRWSGSAAAHAANWPRNFASCSPKPGRGNPLMDRCRGSRAGGVGPRWSGLLTGLWWRWNGARRWRCAAGTGPGRPGHGQTGLDGIGREEGDRR